MPHFAERLQKKEKMKERKKALKMSLCDYKIIIIIIIIVIIK